MKKIVIIMSTMALVASVAVSSAQAPTPPAQAWVPYMFTEENAGQVLARIRSPDFPKLQAYGHVWVDASALDAIFNEIARQEDVAIKAQKPPEKVVTTPSPKILEPPAAIPAPPDKTDGIN